MCALPGLPAPWYHACGILRYAGLSEAFLLDDPEGFTIIKMKPTPLGNVK